MVFLSIDWTAAGTIALAIVGALSFGATIVLAWFTRKAADASVAMIREVQRDRELEVQPYLVFGSVSFPMVLHNLQKVYISPEKRRMIGTVDEMEHLETLEVEIANIGKGPAVACQYIGRFRWEMRERAPDGGIVVADRCFRTHTFSLSSGGKDTYDAEYVNVGAASFAVADLTGDTELEDLNVLLCRDQFEHKYRFVDGQGSPEIFYADRRPTKWWKPGEPDPAWTTGW